MKNKEKRSNIRIELLSEYCEIAGGNYRVMNISDGGAFIKVSGIDMLPKPKEFMYLSFTLPGELGFLTIPGEVTRVNWKANKKQKEMGFAIKFDGLSKGNAKILDAFLVYLRNKQIMSVSKRLIEEFFNK